MAVTAPVLRLSPAIGPSSRPFLPTRPARSAIFRARVRCPWTHVDQCHSAHRYPRSPAASISPRSFRGTGHRGDFHAVVGTASRTVAPVQHPIGWPQTGFRSASALAPGDPGECVGTRVPRRPLGTSPGSQRRDPSAVRQPAPAPVPAQSRSAVQHPWPGPTRPPSARLAVACPCA